MKTIVVLTPTFRSGGIDVALASIMRQSALRTGVAEVHWFLVDERKDDRAGEVSALLKHTTHQLQWPDRLIVHHTKSPPKRDSDFRTLSAAYNIGIAAARALDADLFVSMQDYIWAPADGLEKFLELAEKHPGDLLTGKCSISEDPGVVFNLAGSISIFRDYYNDKPATILWEDVRHVGDYESVVAGNELEWEANWAAFGRGVLESDMWYDCTFDEGIAYDNVDFAYRCRDEIGARVTIDCSNHAISLPHKELYWPKEQHQSEVMRALNDHNRATSNARHGHG